MSPLEDPDAEVYIFAESHLGEASERGVDVPAYAHVEAPRVELVELHVAAADATGGDEGRHRVAYRFLDVGK